VKYLWWHLSLPYYLPSSSPLPSCLLLSVWSHFSWGQEISPVPSLFHWWLPSFSHCHSSSLCFPCSLSYLLGMKWYWVGFVTPLKPFLLSSLPASRPQRPQEREAIVPQVEVEANVWLLSWMDPDRPSLILILWCIKKKRGNIVCCFFSVLLHLLCVMVW
jgi:hypothetical protein